MGRCTTPEEAQEMMRGLLLSVSIMVALSGCAQNLPEENVAATAQKALEPVGGFCIGQTPCTVTSDAYAAMRVNNQGQTTVSQCYDVHVTNGTSQQYPYWRRYDDQTRC